MPLLPRETQLFPDDLLSRSVCEDGADARWWVLHTRPRAEKALARRCLQRGIGFFLPLHEHRWRNRGRWFSSYVPLFPGYVFVHGNHQARSQVLETNLVAHCLPVDDQIGRASCRERV